MCAIMRSDCPSVLWCRAVDKHIDVPMWVKNSSQNPATLALALAGVNLVSRSDMISRGTPLPSGPRRKRNGDHTYLVKWKGYSYEESTWEPKGNFKSHTLKAYHDQRKAERAQQSDSSSEDDDEVSHGEGQKAK